MQTPVKAHWMLLAALLLQGCSHGLKQQIEDEQLEMQMRAEQAQRLARKSPFNSPYMTEDKAPQFTSRSIPYERVDALPPHLGTITMRVPGRHTLTGIAEMIENLVKIPVIMSPDALLDPALFVPSNSGAQASASATATASSRAMSLNNAALQRLTHAGAKNTMYNERELRSTQELNYTGSVTGLLDSIAAKAGLQWQFINGRIEFSRMVTRAMTIKALSTGVKSSGSVSVGGGISASSQTETDIWPMLEATLKHMISARGRMQVDSKSGIVTVTDAVQNVNAMNRFIDQYNSMLLRQVILDVEVLQVDLTQEHAAGINWNAVRNSVNRTSSLTLQSPSASKPISGGDPGTVTAVMNGINGSSTALVQALEQFGRVSTSYSSVVTTSNRQPVPLGVLNSEAYLASVTAGVSNASSGATTGATLTAGSVNTGFSMVLVPLIMDSNRVLIESTVQVSVLREMKSFSSGSGANTNSIQLPNVDTYSTMQRVTVAAGDTIILSGFEREVLIRDETDFVRNYVPASRRGKSTKQSTVILITPRLPK